MAVARIGGSHMQDDSEAFVVPESKEVSKTNQTEPNRTPLLMGYVDQHRSQLEELPKI